MKSNSKPERICPECGETYTAAPALSRKDNKTDICPKCGAREAMAAFGMAPAEIEHTLELMGW